MILCSDSTCWIAELRPCSVFCKRDSITCLILIVVEGLGFGVQKTSKVSA